MQNNVDDDKVPIGISDLVSTPWGTKEHAYVYHVKDIAGKNVRYACIRNPKGNFKVAFSVFRVY